MQEIAGINGKRVALRKATEVGKLRKRRAQELKVDGLHEFPRVIRLSRRDEHGTESYASLMPRRLIVVTDLARVGSTINRAELRFKFLKARLENKKLDFIFGCGGID